MQHKSNFKNYILRFTSQAEKEFEKLEKKDSAAITKKLKDLLGGAFNLDIKKIIGTTDLYRLRSGNYRVLFEVHHNIITILVVSVEHRKEVYRGL